MITMKQLRFIFAPVFLVALVSSELTIVPSGPLERTEGSMLILTCASSSGSTSGLKWLDEDNSHIVGGVGKLIQPNPTDLSLVFTKLSMDDKGLYRCIREVEGGDEEAAIQVNVKKEIKFLSPKEQAVINGTDARVWCRINLVISDRTMKWYQRGPGGTYISVSLLDGDRFIPSYESAAGQEGSYLLIRNANLDDSMFYTCSLEFRNEGTAKNMDINVIVTVPPKIMPIYLDPTSPKEGERLTMTCQADGVPPPTYMFYKGSRPLMEDRSEDGKYTIGSLKRTDEGDYTCNAMNKGGSQNETLTLDVKIPPTFEDTPNVSLKQGQEVRLPCIAVGDPVPSMFWRRKGSMVDYLSQLMSETDIYVDEQTDSPIYDGPTVLHRRTLYLVIPDLKPEHAGEYECHADNQFGSKERMFKIDVLYKPNFNSQEVSLFYGWIGSNTNLTCIADGNPEPMFTWLKDGVELKAGNPDYDISIGNSGLPTRAIGYLKPKVSIVNVGNMFRAYTCRAINKYGNSEQNLVFQKADVPGMATVNVVFTKATEMGLRIFPPSNDGGQPVFKYVVKYAHSDSSDDYLTRNFTKYDDETTLTLEKLTPKTSYAILVYAVNNVGLGTEKKIVELTKDYSIPDPVTVLSAQDGVTGNRFDLMWDVPMTGGRPISNYNIKYTEALKVDSSGEVWKVVRESPDWKIKNVDGQTSTRMTLTGLKKETYYKVMITAVNSIGSSQPTEFVFRTGLGGEEITEDGGPALGAGGIVGLMIVILLLVALAVDAAFFKTKQCGLIWTLSKMFGRKDEGSPGVSKSPEDGDEAATKLLAKDKDDSLRTENEVDKDAPDSGTKAAEDTEGQTVEEKKELEPEDKDKKEPADVTADPAVPSKEAEAPPKEPAGEATTQVETKPPAEEKADKPADA